jgi:hypothetical protein
MDEIEAYAWANVAAAAGDKSAIKTRDRMEVELGREKATTAQKRSKEIFQKIEAARRSATKK